MRVGIARRARAERGLRGDQRMKTATRLRKRINKAMARDRRRQRDQPDELVLNAFAFVMDVNSALLKTVSELSLEFEQIKKDR
ncbi:MAG TPA: hypothetical protein VFZ17_12195 [Acidimicrobiia bacterium]|nr:hypothetical protein [Acidimicrobiia bacterium]